MQIINIDKDPFLSSVKSNSDGHIFAGHVTHIVGKNFPGTEKEALENGITPEYYDNKEKIISAKNLDKLKTI